MFGPLLKDNSGRPTPNVDVGVVSRGEGVGIVRKEGSHFKIGDG